MPAMLEAKCGDSDCPLDMVTLHYTYDMPDDTTVGDFRCPYCGADGLVELEV